MGDNPCVTSSLPDGYTETPPTTQEEMDKLVDDMMTNHSDQMVQTLQAMNIQACKFHKAAGGGGFCSIGCLCCGGGAAAYEDSVGCEQIAVQAQMNVILNSVINCVCQNVSQEQKIDTIQANTLTIRFQNCEFHGDFNQDIVQQNLQSGQVYDFTSISSKTDFSNALENAFQIFQDSLSKTANGSFSDPIAQKTIQDQVTAIENMINNDSVVNIAKETITKTFNSNTLTLIYDGNVFHGNFNQKILQYNSNDYVIQSIVTNLMNAAFDNNVKNDIQEGQKQAQEQANKGIGGLQGLFGIVVVIIIIMVIVGAMKKGKGGFLSGDGECQTSVLLKAITSLCSFLVVFGIIVYIIGWLFGKGQWRSSGIAFIVIGICFLVGAIIFITVLKKQCQNKHSGGTTSQHKQQRKQQQRKQQQQQAKVTSQ